jgi:hypothetical protein
MDGSTQHLPSAAILTHSVHPTFSFQPCRIHISLDGILVVINSAVNKQVGLIIGHMGLGGNIAVGRGWKIDYSHY